MSGNSNWWCLEHDNRFSVSKWAPQSPGLHPAEQLWDVMGQEIHFIVMLPTNPHHLHDAVILKWTNIFVECFQHLVESVPERINEREC